MERRNVGFLVLGFLIGHVGFRLMWHGIYWFVIVWLFIALQLQIAKTNAKSLPDAKPTPVVEPKDMSP